MTIKVSTPSTPPRKRITARSIKAKKQYDQLVSMYDNYGRVYTVEQYFRIAEYRRLGWSWEDIAKEEKRTVGGIKLAFGKFRLAYMLLNGKPTDDLRSIKKEVTEYVIKREPHTEMERFKI